MAPPALAPARQDPRPSKTGELAKLEKALQEARLRDQPEESLKQALRYCFMLVGLRAKNMPDEMEKAFLINFIREHYGGHTAAEIRLAFDMAVTGKLDVDPVCYENFSVTYFAKIMNAFRGWARDQVRAIEAAEPIDRVLSRDELVDLNVEYALYLFRQINKLPIKI